MDFRKVYSAEGACCLGGLAFIAMAFVSDLAQHLAAFGAEAGHAQGGDFFIRVNIPVMGVACIAFGLGMYIVNESRDRVHVIAYVAGLPVPTGGDAPPFSITGPPQGPLPHPGVSPLS